MDHGAIAQDGQIERRPIEGDELRLQLRDAIDKGGDQRLLRPLAHVRRPKRRYRPAPFLLALFLLFMGYSGFAISLWPNIVPPGISIREAAAPPEAMGFTLVGALLVIPIILTYTAWSYYVFRGKVRSGEGYH